MTMITADIIIVPTEEDTDDLSSYHFVIIFQNYNYRAAAQSNALRLCAFIFRKELMTFAEDIQKS